MKEKERKTEKIFVLAINGSPHKNGITVSVLNKFLTSAKKHGAEVKLIHLVDYYIKHCLGCYSINPKLCTYPCKQKDDMNKLCKLLLKADILVFGSPIYWFNMSGLMKNFIDRLCCLAVIDYKLEGKIGIFFACSKENEGGRVNATLAMASAMNHLGLIIPPYSILFYPSKEKIVKKGKVVWYNWILKDAERLAAKTIEFCDILKKEKFKWR